MLEMPTADALERYLTLTTQQMKLTATNMANQNTDGYTRRVASFSNNDTVNVNGISTSSGVSATVTAQRDRVLQRSLQQATEASSASSARTTALDNLQSLFMIDSSGDDASGIGAAISNFFNSMTSLGSSPSDTNTRQTAYTAAQALVTTMNRTASQLSSQTSSLNQQIGTSVDQVNSLLTNIASLNKQIQQSGGQDTDGLQDQRDQAVLSLAKLVDVNTVTATDGTVNLSLSDGTPLLSGTQAMNLSTATVSGNLHILSNGNDVTSSVLSGSIGGLLQVRDQDIPAVQQQLDAVAVAISSAVNAQNAAGTDANGNAGGDVFSGNTAATLSMAISSGGGIAASSDGSNATAIGAVASQAIVGSMTASGAFSTMITSLGQTVSGASTTKSANDAVLTQTSTQVANVSGVSLDTEAANLTQYQRSYEAAAKVLSIANELMAQAINLGQQTTVS
ncbi:flagellar hook-associated protein FlgK [Terriglobus roseus]|uniref:Flagellar hook-associated protein 1 n=1 Tax=Terriglobus roseus TaxID=392734 RepID=A0A1G7ICW2_9BACT|nr:flagellar hook-associated protein FlgK [Terriglobus roseus]SDF10189.1 flagellar hook-associated protein 1 FlgK [Terriglobus roseus]